MTVEARNLPAQSHRTRPPVPTAAILGRARLHSRLSASLKHRLTLVTGGAGAGKTTALAAFAHSVGGAWYTLDERDRSLDAAIRGIAAALGIDISNLMVATAGPGGEPVERARAAGSELASRLEASLREDLALILDDVHEIDGSEPVVAFIETLCRQAPAYLRPVIATRTSAPFPIARLRGRGELLEISAAELAFDPHEVAQILSEVAGPSAATLAERLRSSTAGWPAAVRMAAEALRGAPEPDSALGRLAAPGTALFAYLAEEAFEWAGPSVRDLVRRASLLERFRADQCSWLGIEDASLLGDPERAAPFLQDLGEGWFAVTDVVRDFVREHVPLDASERTEVMHGAARWFESQGAFAEMARALLAAGLNAEARTVVEEHGDRMLAAGDLAVVIAARSAEDDASPRLELLAGTAHQIRGDWTKALAAFERAAADDGPIPPGLAWRLGVIAYFQGESGRALEVFARASSDGALEERALLESWRATALWASGDADACRASVTTALELATAAGDPGALASAHTVLAMLSAHDGDRTGNRQNYDKALAFAEQAGDVLQQIRIRANRASAATSEGRYDDALADLEVSVRQAEVTGFSNFISLGYNNLGEARLMLGRYDEALAAYEAAKDVYETIASRFICYPLAGMGNLHRERGNLALARAAYEEALQVAQTYGNAQVLATTLAGLARVEAADDLERALTTVERALTEARGPAVVAANLASGWIHLLAGDTGRASEHAAAAGAEARPRRDRASLAEVTELEGAIARSPVKLREAASHWKDLNSPVRAAYAALAAALYSGDNAQRQRAERDLRALGEHLDSPAAAGLRALLPSRSDAPVMVRTLGGFAVMREGKPVAPTEWQSKKARDLLKILISARGRPVTRDRLMEWLWPGEDPAKSTRRLSVALTTVRGVLDPDKTWPAERFVTGDDDAVRIVPGELPVDIERFLAEAEAGLRAEGHAREGLLARAEEEYAGDYLEEDLYEDWSGALREEGRAAYVAVCRALADTTSSPDAALRYRLRILERDPYDEEAHLALISTLSSMGRHGEARRAYRAYASRMAEEGLEAAPYPSRVRSVPS